MGDRADRDHCYAVYGPPLRRCAGDRLVVDGYVCPHCDSTNPRTTCLKPTGGRKPIRS
jgi:hypothetical protein